MGQRHQIYITLNINGKIVRLNFHNQWLYGKGAMKNCLAFLEVIHRHVIAQVQGKGIVHTIDEKVLGALSEDGEKRSCYVDDCDDPRYGDNNNGVTIIDARNPACIKYCFMAVSAHQECLEYSECLKEFHTPYSKDHVSPVVGYPLNAKHWIYLHYDPSADEEIAPLIREFDKHKLLHPLELAELFPDMYAQDGSGMTGKSRDYMLASAYRGIYPAGYASDESIDIPYLIQLYDLDYGVWHTRRKNFIMFLCGYGYRAMRRHKEAPLPVVEAPPAVNDVFYNEGLTRLLTTFL